MMNQLTLHAWNDAPSLPPELEKEAAHELLAFLNTLETFIDAHDREGTLGQCHHVFDFAEFSAHGLDFMLPSIGRGDVQIELHDGLVKIEETGIPCLWRMQMGEQDALILAQVPRCVEVEALKGSKTLTKLVNDNDQVFAAPAILEELKHALATQDLATKSEEPAFMVELTNQPMSEGDRRALSSTLGTGDIEVRISGFAQSLIRRTQIRGIWYHLIQNNSGKTLLEAYVVSGLPPEVASPLEGFKDAKKQIGKIREWVQTDLDRGVLGGNPEDVATTLLGAMAYDG